MSSFYGLVAIDDTGIFICVVDDVPVPTTHGDVYCIPRGVYDIVSMHVASMNFGKLLNEKDKNGNCPFWENNVFDQIRDAICMLNPTLNGHYVANALSMKLAESKTEKKHAKKRAKKR